MYCCDRKHTNIQHIYAISILMCGIVFYKQYFPNNFTQPLIQCYIAIITHAMYL